MATKKKVKTKTVFVLPDGSRYDVTGENGKYIFCGDTQFRKSAGRGKLVKENAAQATEKETEG